MKEKKVMSLVSVLFLLLSIPATVFAIRAAQRPTEQAGGYYHTLVDRVNISADYTDFTFRFDNETDVYEIGFQLTLEKSEADFYARLDDLQITGLRYENARFACKTAGLENATPNALFLPVENGNSIPLTWDVTINATFAEKGEYQCALNLEYTAGITAESADSRMLVIPLTIHVI